MNRSLRLLSLVACALVVLAWCGNASIGVVIPDLYNTGVGNNKLPLADGTIGDPHFSLFHVPSGTSNIRVRTEAGGYPVDPAGHWLLNDGLSAWIGPNNSNQLLGPEGLYIYRTTFNLTEEDLDVNIFGKWATDNTGTTIKFNGVVTGNSTTGGADGFSHWSSFAIQATGVVGTNTLDFYVSNIASDPTGLRVEFVPEPSTLVLLGIGIVSLLAFSLRRK